MSKWNGDTGVGALCPVCKHNIEVQTNRAGKVFRLRCHCGVRRWNDGKPEWVTRTQEHD